jgi:hypothetical protein
MQEITSPMRQPVRMTETEQEQQRRVQRDLGQRRQHPHDRPDHGVDRRMGRRGDADRHAENHRDRKSGE